MDAATVRRTPSRSAAFGFTLVEIMIVLAIVGVLTAIAVPNFIRFQARSKQSEAKTNLRALFTSEKSYFGEREAYSPFARLIGFTPERGNRYAYRLTPGCGNRTPRALAASRPRLHPRPRVRYNSHSSRQPRGGPLLER